MVKISKQSAVRDFKTNVFKNETGVQLAVFSTQEYIFKNC